MSAVTVFVPATIGNVGPGFDVLGLCIGGLGDKITLELTNGPSNIGSVVGKDAELIPRNPEENCTVIAAMALLRKLGDPRQVKVSFERKLAISGGLGASAAASVAGALGAAHALGRNIRQEQILSAALEAEATVAGWHLDNIAPCFLGGLCLVRDVKSFDIVRVPIAAPFWLTVITPNIKLETRYSRSVLPEVLSQHDFVQQMANTTALVAGFAKGDRDLVSRSLEDRYAEPRRAALIPHYYEVKHAAKAAGALGCSLSGAGPSLFAISSSQEIAHTAGVAMRAAFGSLQASVHVGPVSQEGATVL